MPKNRKCNSVTAITATPTSGQFWPQHSLCHRETNWRWHQSTIVATWKKNSRLVCATSITRT